MNTAEDIITALRNPAIPLSTDDIKTCWALLKSRHSSNSTLQAQAFRVGDEVEFDARGEVKRGTVTKINQKTVSVKVGVVTWKVSAALLRKG